jgi:hypothetical protein
MPRTLAQNAQYIAETIKPAIKQAIEDKGVTVPSTDSFLDYADRIGEIEGGGSGYQLKDLPTGSISTVTDAAELPLNALKVSVEAWQEGSGDPSPSNIRPIHGWDSGEIGVVSDYSKAECFNGLKIGTYGYVDLGTLTWTNYKTGGYQSRVTNAKGGGAGNAPKCILSNGFISKNADTILQDGEMTIVGNNIYLVDTDYPSDAEAFKQSLQGVYMIYELYLAVTPSITPEQYAALKNAFNYSENTTTQQFPQTIYGAEWDVVDGELKQTDGYIASYNGETLPSTWISDRDVYASGTTPTTGAEVVYKLATPTTIPQQAESIRMLEGVNNLYADCGEVLEGEYFVDEGALDTRKVDYSIGSNTALKISDGRILQGFVQMSGYHALPLGSDGAWLDIDWSKSFEIGIAFKYTVADTNQTLFGSGIGNASYYKCPVIMLHPASQQFEIDISTTGNSWDMTMSQTVTYASLTVNTWYFLKMTFDQSTMSLVVQISDDFSTWDTLLSITMSAAYYHDTASLCFGGFVQNSSFSSNNLLIDTFNTYIKGDGVSWGASTGAFPS